MSPLIIWYWVKIRNFSILLVVVRSAIRHPVLLSSSWAPETRKHLRLIQNRYIQDFKTGLALVWLLHGPKILTTGHILALQEVCRQLPLLDASVCFGIDGKRSPSTNSCDWQYPIIFARFARSWSEGRACKLFRNYENLSCTAKNVTGRNGRLPT